VNVSVLYITDTDKHVNPFNNEISSILFWLHRVW